MVRTEGASRVRRRLDQRDAARRPLLFSLTGAIMLAILLPLRKRTVLVTYRTPMRLLRPVRHLVLLVGHRGGHRLSFATQATSASAIVHYTASVLYTVRGHRVVYSYL